MRNVLVPLLALVLGLGALSGVQDTAFREHVEDTLTESSQRALAAAGLARVDVELTGRDAAVTAPSDADALAGAQVVRDVTGVRTAEAFGPAGSVPADAVPAEPATPDAPPAGTEPDTAPDTEPDTEPEPETASPEDEEADEPVRAPTRQEREAAQEDLVEIPTITFVTDSARLTKDGRRVVRGAATVLEKHPEVEVRIEGHTDSIGSTEHNQRLSERRARTVLDRLVELGVDEDRLSAKGFGESDPLVVPTTSEDLEKNRRVEFVVTR